MPNPFYAYILNIYDLVCLVGFYGISTIVGYLIPNPMFVCVCVKEWFSLVWFYGISIIIGYLMPNSLYTYILNI